MGRAYLVISPELLAAWLYLPAGTVIPPTGHLGHGATRAANVELIVEHPDIPDTAPDHALPTVEPLFQQDAPNVVPSFIEWNVRRG